MDNGWFSLLLSVLGTFLLTHAFGVVQREGDGFSRKGDVAWDYLLQHKSTAVVVP